MTNVLRTAQKQYGFKSMVAAIGVSMLFILIGQKPIAKGLMLGSLFSVLNFILIGEMLPIGIGLSRNRFVIFSFTSILFRFVLLSTPLILALKLESMNFAAAVIGIFMVQLVIMADHLIRKIYPE